jgi:hypothetical protein
VIAVVRLDEASEGPQLAVSLERSVKGRARLNLVEELGQRSLAEAMETSREAD